MKIRHLEHSDNWATPKEFLGVNTKGEFVDNKSPMHDSIVIIF